MLLREPVSRLSAQTTVWPSASNASQRWEPTNPAPPVTSMRIGRTLIAVRHSFFAFRQNARRNVLANSGMANSESRTANQQTIRAEAAAQSCDARHGVRGGDGLALRHDRS